MAEFILSIDAGGTAVKVAVVSADGAERAVVTATPRLVTPAPGHAERDPAEMWATVAAAIPQALARAGIGAGDVAIIGLTGYGNGLHLVDADGRAVMNGVLASDIRAAAIVEEWAAAGLETEHVARTCQRLWPGTPAAIIAWLQRHRPDLLAGAHAVLMCKDFLRLRLTGRIAAEVTDQSTAALVGFDRSAVDRPTLAMLGLAACERLFPPVVETMTVAGEVTREAAAATGLRAGIPVAAGLCDNLAVMYGTGVVDTSGVVVMSGTWGLHQSFLAGPVTDGSVLICAHGARPGEWLAIEGSPTSASSLEWFVETFLRAGADGGDAQDLYALCNRLVAETAPDGPPVYFLPFLNGAIDCSAARGSLVGFSSWHRLGHAVRAVYEGVAFEHRRHLERLCRARPAPAVVRFAGGAAKSRPWSEIFAAALGLTLEVPVGSEFAARGAALVAGVVAGLVPSLSAIAGATPIDRTIAPDPALAALLDRRYLHYRALLSALAPHWKEIAR
jgi:L-xylulokinase